MPAPMEARRAKWWGWGFEDVAVPVDARPGLWRHVRETLRLPDVARGVVRLEDVQLPPSRLPKDALEALTKIAGEENVAADHATRVHHAAGRSYRDLLALRSGRIERAPDAVVFPDAEDVVTAVLAYADAHGLAVIPFGGGTSAVGGVGPDPADARPALTLDLRRMRRVLAVDLVSLTATAEAGIRGPLLEEALRDHGVTLGHVPQSFEFSTLGGWAATRSTGALSNRYGRIEDLVVSLRLVHPGGAIDTLSVPASAAGPSLKEMLLGSEGILGVITQLTVRVHRIAPRRRHASFYFRAFDAGVDALREMAQSGAPPAMAYLSDEAETEAIASGGPPPAGTRAGALARIARGRGGGSLLVLMFEGTDGEARSQRRVAKEACRQAVGLGAYPARAFEEERFATPYLRDSLMDRGVMVETVETAASWSRLLPLYAAAKDALLKAIWADGVAGLVLCHVSHVYRDGASLYFTFLAPQKAGDEVGQWRRAKAAVTDAFLANGGTVTHHHGVGTDHRAWVAREWGPSGVAALRALKAQLDPRGTMNPGKLLPPTG